MRVLMFVPLFYPHIGGVEKHTIEIANSLCKQGHKVIIITKKHINTLRDNEIINNIKIIRIPNKNLIGIWKYLFKYRKFFRKCEIIHCHDFNTFYWYLPFILINSNIYITFHGFEKYPIPKLYIILRKVAEIFTKGNICVGKFISKYYKTKPTFIVYGGVNTKKINDVNEINNKILNSALFIGRLEPDTGILEYIKAIKILKYEYNRDISLEVCGDGRLRKVIEDYAEKNRLTINVNGFIKNLDEFYDKSGVVLSSSYLSLLESLNKKKLVISIYQNELKKDYLNLSPFRDYILITKNPKEIAESLVKFFERNKEFTTKIRNGYKFSLNNDWTSLVRIYMKLWKSGF